MGKASKRKSSLMDSIRNIAVSPEKNGNSSNEKRELEVTDGEKSSSSDTEVKIEENQDGMEAESSSATKVVKRKRTSKDDSSPACNGQQTLNDMFKKMSSKKPKRDPGDESTEVGAGDVKKESTGALVRCSDCRQILDINELKLFHGDSDDSVEEFVALTDKRLSVFNEDADINNDVMELPQHRVTCFTVYDKHTHLCPFDNGLIERDVELYFSGYVKPIYDDNPSPEGGIATKCLGPISSWWTAGFDGGENAVIGFTTIYADYILMEPSEAYAPFIDALKEKIYMSKLVIETLLDSPDITYEDLLNKLETTAPPQGIMKYTEDALLRHAQFVVDQVQSFDHSADDDETLLVTQPCMRSLVSLAGVTLGKRRAMRRVERSAVRAKKPVESLATTTKLVRDIFEILFKEQIETGNEKVRVKRQRCGVCEACQSADCGTCKACKNMVKFGGNGRMKQCCEQRRCLSKAFQDAEADNLDEEIDDEMDKKAKSQPPTPVKRHTTKKQKTAVSWTGSPFLTTNGKKYYKTANIGDKEVSWGDYVYVTPENPRTPLYVAQIIYMYESSNNEKKFHAQWFWRGSDTILGETSDPLEVFVVYDCEDQHLSTISDICKVIKKEVPEDWFTRGGNYSLEDETVIEHDDGKTFFYQKLYQPETARFEDPPEMEHPHNESELDSLCVSCKWLKQERELEKPQLGEVLEETDGKIHYCSVSWKGKSYGIDECAFFDSDAFTFALKLSPTKKASVKKDKENIDEDKYPELYRKGDYIKGSNADLPQPFKIGQIISIYSSSKKSQDPENIKIKIRKFYRPEDTHKGLHGTASADLNMLYHSQEETVVCLSAVQGKCYIVYSENIQGSKEEFIANGPYRFYFSEAYDKDAKEFIEPPYKSQLMGSIGKGKGKGKSSQPSKVSRVAPPEEYPKISKKLKGLDVFAGCGGLSEGFHQAGVVDTLWAIERDEAAANAFRLNFPNCTIFTDDCNFLLKSVIEGKTKNNKGQVLPQKGDVELLCGGPPCQGFSGMNRFNSRQYSLFKNSLISSYLSYCEYYRPRYFVLENVRNFVSFKKSMVLKLALRCLIGMGYQCTFGVLQAGNYGVPQTRRRAIILAAAPGEKLPFYPEPEHVFAPRACQLSVMVDDKKYLSNCQWTSSAPFRTITVRDAMSDLPNIKNGAKKEEISYTGDPKTHFQRLMRGKHSQPVLRDHICKDMAPLVEARFRHIPLSPGSDWRELPNIELILTDGTRTKKLMYTHNDTKNGKSSTGALRGVCSCAEGKQCDPMDRQFSTLIPWCLPHTGNRHNHWAGLYGRLEWDGFFSTTVTNPEPMGKQGRVLHPEQHRVVSVRECARSQGFPDHYRFFGNILDRHRQVGNAVPPPLGAALGREILKSVAAAAVKCE